MENNVKKIILKCVGAVLCALLLIINYSDTMRAIREMPDNIYLDDAGCSNLLQSIRQPFVLRGADGDMQVASDLSERLYNGENDVVTIDLFGIIPVKQVSMHARNSVMVMPGGQSIGVTLHTAGALVVGLGNVEVNNDEWECPADSAGIRPGDVIIRAAGEEIKDAQHLIEVCMRDGDSIPIVIKRGEQRVDAVVKPVVDIKDGKRKVGMWVRDSTVGIGTLSFYTLQDSSYGALGHAIVDVDTGSILSVKDGEIADSSVLGVSQGTQGFPGEIHGTFSGGSKRLGSIEQNTKFGIFGQLYGDMINPLYPDGMPLAYPEEAKLGPATLLTTVDSEGVKEYECEIMKLYTQTQADVKSMVIKITDKKLLEITGGIVQGMSGSPIIQNGKLLGVVTHVFLNDPTKGYCIYALWMKNLC
ncbi:MAG: SpoIVB peptidase [Clostridia bacterium]